MLKLNDELDGMVENLEAVVGATILEKVFKVSEGINTVLNGIKADPTVVEMVRATIMIDMTRDIFKSMMDIISVVAALSDKEYYNLLKEDPDQFEVVIAAVIKSTYPIKFPKKED